MRKISIILALLFCSPICFAQSWNSSGNNSTTGRLGFGTTTPQIDINISRSNETTSGMHVFNTHPSSRSVTLLGEGWGGKYIYMGYQNSTYSATNEAFEPSTGIIFTGAQNGLRLISSTYTSFYAGDYGEERMRISKNGNVGIGTSSPDSKLTVKGHIHTQEVKVDLNGAVAPDYVFEENYPLPSLEATEAYIQAHKHLPEIPSAAEMEANGIQLKEMNLLLLKKMEEMTLHIIEMDKKIDNQASTIACQEEKIKTLEALITK